MPRHTKKRRGGRKRMRGGAKRRYELHKAGKQFDELMCFTPPLTAKQETELLETLRSISAETSPSLSSSKSITPTTVKTSPKTVSDMLDTASPIQKNINSGVTKFTDAGKASVSAVQNAANETYKNVKNKVTTSIQKLQNSVMGTVVGVAKKVQDMATPSKDAMQNGEKRLGEAIGKFTNAAQNADIVAMTTTSKNADNIMRKVVNKAKETEQKVGSTSPTIDSTLSGISGGSRKRRRRRKRRTRRKKSKRKKTRHRRKKKKKKTRRY